MSEGLTWHSTARARQWCANVGWGRPGTPPGTVHGVSQSAVPCRPLADHLAHLLANTSHDVEKSFSWFLATQFVKVDPAYTAHAAWLSSDGIEVLLAVRARRGALESGFPFVPLGSRGLLA